MELLFIRKEYKYIVPKYLMSEAISYFCSWLDADKHNKDNKPYTVNSLYFDSPDLRFYEEKIIGDANRDKIRLRTYSEQIGEEPLFLEIKNKKFDKIFKDRSKVQIDSNFSDVGVFSNIGNFINEDNKAEMEKAFIYDKIYHLKPIVEVAYKRIAYWASSVDFKVSIDFDIKAAQGQNFWKTDKNGYEKVLSDNFILELKYRDYVHTKFQSFVLEHDLQRVPFSKYTESVDVIVPYVKWLQI